MTPSPVVVSSRGGKGLYKSPANGLRNPGTKSKPKKFQKYLGPDEVRTLMKFALNVFAGDRPIRSLTGLKKMCHAF